jgi:hypothetical protein
MSVRQNSFTHLRVPLVLTDRGIIIIISIIIISRSKSPIAPPSVQAPIMAVINLSQLEQDGDLRGLVRVLENAKADAAAILQTFVGATSASKAPCTIDVAQLERDGDIRGLVWALEDAKADSTTKADAAEALWVLAAPSWAKAVAVVQAGACNTCYRL